MKMYNRAPLPFKGQKRNFLKDYKEALQTIGNEIDTVVDLFGGSGLLSHVAKRVLPGCRVIYNDYDGYTERLAHIDQTNELLDRIRTIVAGVEKEGRLSEEQRNKVCALLADAEAGGGWVDNITISSNIEFSGREKHRKGALYNCVRLDGYTCEGYLDGLEVAHLDYRELYERERHNPRALFILDPPYLTTDVGTYKSADYWQLRDYLDVLNILRKDNNYIYFTSSKSQLIEVCRWLCDNYGDTMPMYGAEIRSRQNRVNWSSVYEDIMVINVRGGLF